MEQWVDLWAVCWVLFMATSPWPWPGPGLQVGWAPTPRLHKGHGQIAGTRVFQLPGSGLWVLCSRRCPLQNGHKQRCTMANAKEGECFDTATQ